MGNKFSIPRPRKGEAASPRGDPDYWRQEARQHAHRRNDFLEKSQQAYRQNKGAEAKALSLQGKEEARLMEEANRKASEASFAANNASVEADFIDLHGLYVREAEVVGVSPRTTSMQHVGPGPVAETHLQPAGDREEDRSGTRAEAATLGGAYLFMSPLQVRTHCPVASLR